MHKALECINKNCVSKRPILTNSHKLVMYIKMLLYGIVSAGVILL